MGTSTILDIMGAMIIGGMLLLNMMNVFSTTGERSAQYNSELMVQQNLVSFTSMLEYDFRKIGYQRGQENLLYAANAISVAETQKLVFYADLDNDGTQERVEYSVGSAAGCTETPNPNDLPFYRKINGNGEVIRSIGITDFTLQYFDYTGTQISAPVSNIGQISTISVTVKCESPYFSAQETNYNAEAYWKQIRLAIPNLRYK